MSACVGIIISADFGALRLEPVDICVFGNKVC